MLHKFFVDVDWLKDHLNDENLIILDIPYGMNEFIKDKDSKKRKFENEHIPNAIHIDQSELQSKQTELNLFDANQLKDTFLNKGIDSSSNVIIYSDGIIASARVALALYWLGVDNIKLLLGGINEWKKKGYPLTSNIKEVIPKKSFGCEVPKRPEIILSTPEDVINQQENNPNFVLANIRSWDEFVGIKSGYPYIEGTGAPYGSVYAKATSDRVNVEYILDEKGNFANLSDLLEEWSQWGITEDKEVAFFCGAGWRAAAVFFILKDLGWENVSVYDGGWYQWNSYHKKNPDQYRIQVGNPLSDEGIRII